MATSVVESHLCSNQVSRYHMGSYLCIASNGVLPSVSKRINLIVMCEYRSWSFHWPFGWPLMARWPPANQRR